MFIRKIIDDKLEGDIEEEEQEEDQDNMINLKTNNIPKGMLEIKYIFDWNESTHHKRTPKEKGSDGCDSYNQGTKDDPRLVKIGKTCSAWERDGILHRFSLL